MTDNQPAIQTIQPQNPTQPQNNDLNIQLANLMRNTESITLGFKLNGQNYPLWMRLMKVAIGGRGKSSHITGHPPPPEKTDPAYYSWEESDLTVFSWLIQNMENKLIHNFAQYQTAKAMWDGLATTYGSSKDPFQIYDLEVKANKVSQDQSTLEDYWNELQSIWVSIDQRDPNPLGCCEQGISKYNRLISERRLFQFLSGLDVKYDSIRRDILKEQPIPSAESAFATVRREAARLRILESATNPQIGNPTGGIGTGLAARHSSAPRSDNLPRNPTSKNFSRSGNTSSSRAKIDKSKLYCTHCGMQKHTKEMCFRLVGYPEWWEDGHKQAQAKAKSVIGVEGQVTVGARQDGAGVAMVARSQEMKMEEGEQGEKDGNETTGKGCQDWRDHWAWH